MRKQLLILGLDTDTFQWDKEKVLGLLRHVLTFIGGVLIWRGLSAESDVQLWSGILVEFVTIIFSWAANDKETNLDALKGVVRHVITSLAGYGVLKGWYDENTLFTIVGIVFGVLGGGWSLGAKQASERKLALREEQKLAA